MCESAIDGRSLRSPLTASSRLRVAGVRVVEPDHLQPLSRSVMVVLPVAQHLGPAALERAADLIGARPVVVVAEHGHDRRLEQPDHLGQLIQVELAVTDEVAGEEDQVGVLGVGHLDRGPLHLERRDAADVQIGQVRDPQVARPGCGRPPGPRTGAAGCRSGGRRSRGASWRGHGGPPCAPPRPRPPRPSGRRRPVKRVGTLTEPLQYNRRRDQPRIAVAIVAHLSLQRRPGGPRQLRRTSGLGVWTRSRKARAAWLSVRALA